MNVARSVAPAGLASFLWTIPGLKPRAIVGRPCGTKTRRAARRGRIVSHRWCSSRFAAEPRAALVPRFSLGWLEAGPLGTVGL